MSLRAVSGKWDTRVVWLCACRKHSYSPGFVEHCTERDVCDRCYVGPVIQITTNTRRDA